MKNKILVLTMLFAIGAPQIVSAAWWNPFSWRIFHETDSRTYQSDSKSKQSAEVPTATKFYVQYDNSRVRSCASENCKIIGYYHTNNDFTYPGTIKLKDLPEWIGLTIPEAPGGIGYINKSLLSEAPISVQSTNQTNNKPIDVESLNTGDMVKINEWLAYIDFEIESSLDLIDQVNDSTISDSADDVLDTIETYIRDLNVTRSQLITAATSNRRTTVLAVLTKAQGLRDDFDIELKLSMDNSLQDAERAVNRARVQATEDAYRRIRAEQQAATEATNAYVERYNAIRQQGAREGAMETVINAQLNAAGLMRQTTCSFSSVGGMTSGAGSMVCY